MNKKLLTLCLDTLHGRVEAFSEHSEKANEAIRQAFVQLLGDDPRTLRKNMRNHQNEIFALMEEILDETLPEAWKTNPFFNQFVDVKNLRLGDEREFIIEDNSRLLVSEYSGNHWDVRRQKIIGRQAFTLPTVWLTTSVYNDFERFVKGIVTFTDMITRAQDSFVQEINDRIYDAFMRAGTLLPSEFTETGVFDKDTLLDLIARVQTANGNGAPPVIAGTYQSLAPLMDSTVSYYSDSMKDERNRTGRIRMWEGINLLEIPNSFKPQTFEFKLTDKKLFILPNAFRPVKLLFEGDSRAKAVSDNQDNLDMSYDYTFATKVGIGVVFNKLYGAYTIE